MVKTDLNLRSDMQVLGQSLDFLEAEIERVFLEIEKAEINHNYQKVEKLKDQLMQLLQKLDQENKEIEATFSRYRRQMDDEEKALLSCINQASQVFIRGVPPNSGRAHPGQSLQGKVEATKTGVYH